MKKKVAATSGKAKRARTLSKKRAPRPKAAPKAARARPMNVAGKAVSVQIAKLKVGHRLRSPDPKHVEELAQSMSEVGLLEPIGVTRSHRLVYGGSRLDAAKRLKWKRIPAVVLTINDTEAKLVEIDENLVRQELSPPERGEYTVQRKELYEQLHPETRQGGAPGRAGGGKAKTPGTRSFVADTAAKTGRGRSTIAEDIKIGRLPKRVLSVLKGTPVEKKKGQLSLLTRIKDPEEQLARAKELATEGDRPTADVARKRRPRQAQQEQSGGAEPRAADVQNAGGAAPPTPHIADQAARALAWVAGVLQSYAPQIHEGYRQHLLQIADTSSQHAQFLWEHHVPQAACACCNGGGCAECSGKGWLSRANLAQRQGQAQPVQLSPPVPANDYEAAPAQMVIQPRLDGGAPDSRVPAPGCINDAVANYSDHRSPAEDE